MTIYYVDTNSIGGVASDDNAGTSLAQPWKTIGKANSVLTVGKTVYIRGGTYDNQQIKPSNSGTSGNYITYQNYNNEEVIITGGTAQISMDNKSYIAIDGLKFYHPAAKGRWAWISFCDHVKIDNCVFDNYDARYGKYQSFRIQNSDYFWFTDTIWTSDDINWEWGDRQNDMISVFDISHFLFLRCTLGDASHASFGFTRGVGDDAGVGNHVHEDGDYIVFKDCLFTNKWRTGLGTWAMQKRLLVDRCTFAGIGRENHQCPWADDRNRISSAIYNSGSYNIFRRNTFYGNDNPYGLRAGVMAGTYFKSGHNWFYGNTVYDTDTCDGNDPTQSGAKYSGVIIFGGSDEADYTGSEYSRFINNIFWKIEGDNSNRHFGVYGAGYPRNNIIKHNIFGQPDGSVIQGRWTYPGGIWTIAELETQHGDWISGAGTHYSFDPKFVNPDAATPDFTLQSNSPCIDAGTWLTTIISNTANNQTSIILEDATPFYSGAGAPWFIEGEVGDTIKTQNDQITTIQSINYGTNTIIVSPAIDIISGEGLALTYNGFAPDIGAYEYEGNLCEDFCDGTTRYYNGVYDPTAGECLYQEEVNSEICGYDPCEGVVCEDICIGTTRYYNGVCINGECFYEIEPNSETCGYVPPEDLEETPITAYLIIGGVGLALLAMMSKK